MNKKILGAMQKISQAFLYKWPHYVKFFVLMFGLMFMTTTSANNTTESIDPTAINSLDFLSEVKLDALNRNSIYTLSDLSQKTQAQLLTIPSIGPQTVELIEEALNEVGLSLSPSERDSLDVLPTQTRNALNGNGIYTLSDLSQKTKAQLLEIPGIGLQAIEYIETALNEVGLSLSPSERDPLNFLPTRERNTLNAHGIYTLSDLSQKTETQLVGIPGIGLQTIERIKIALDKNELSFAIDPAIVYWITQLTKKSIEFLNFRYSITTNLKSQNINTVGDLIIKTENEMLQIPEIKNRDVLEIRLILYAHGLKPAGKPSVLLPISQARRLASYMRQNVTALGIDTETTDWLKSFGVNSIKDLMDKYKELPASLKALVINFLEERNLFVIYQRYYKHIEPSGIPVVQQSIEELEIDAYLLTWLKIRGIVKIVDIIQYTETQLMNLLSLSTFLPKKRRSFLVNIKKSLLQIGLKLKLPSGLPNSSHPLQALGPLSPEVLLVLWEHNISSIEDLIQHTETELDEIFTLQSEPVDEIKTSLKSVNMNLKEESHPFISQKISDLPLSHGTRVILGRLKIHSVGALIEANETGALSKLKPIYREEIGSAVEDFLIEPETCKDLIASMPTVK